MNIFNPSQMRMLSKFAYLKKFGVFMCGVFFLLCFVTGCYNICHRTFSEFVHSVILDDRYDNYTCRQKISEQITFYGNGAHGYLRNNATGKKVLRDVRWVRTASNETDTLACYASKGFRGYLDVRTGKPVIPAEHYTKAWLFSEGLAAVMEKDGTIKFIDTRGNVVIENDFHYPAFSYGYLFYDSLCAMTDASGKWGIINRKGDWVVQPEYDGIAHKDQGFWLLNKNERKGLLNNKAKSVLPVEYRYIDILVQGISVVLEDYTMNMMNFDGTLKHKFVCDEVDDLFYSETNDNGEDTRKLAPCKSYGTYAGHCGLLGQNGRPITKPIFTNIYAVSSDIYYCQFDHSSSGILLDGNGRIANE